MWLQNGEVGNALFCLEKQEVQYYYFAEKWTDKILYDKALFQREMEVLMERSKGI